MHIYNVLLYICLASCNPPPPLWKQSAAPRVTSWCHRLVSKNFMWGLSRLIILLSRIIPGAVKSSRFVDEI